MHPTLRQVLLSSSYCPQARAAFAAMTVPPSGPLRRLYNTAILAFIAAGLWAKDDCRWLINVETAQAARVNLKNPGTYDLTAVGGPTFTPKVGYTGNGSTAYLDTGFDPSTAGGNFVRDSAGASAFCLKSGQDAAAILGQLATTSTYIYPRFTDDNAYGRVNAGVGPTVASVSGTGLWRANRSTSLLNQLYKSGASVGADSSASSAPVSSVIALLRKDTERSAAGISSASIGSSYTAQNAADEATIIAAFNAGVAAL